jgi:predicted Zn-dependent protease
MSPRETRALLVALCSVTVLLAAVPSAAQPRRAERKDREDSIVDALNEAIPLGKDAVRAIVKPMLDTVTISPGEEMEIGEEFYRQIADELKGKLDTRRRDVEYVSAVGQALARSVQRKGIRYKFHVVEEAVPNAFAIPGGHVFVYRGLLDKVVQNEAQLAAVLGHEIGHVDAEHAVDFFKPVKASAQLPFADVTTMVAALMSNLLSLTYEEAQESESDLIGTRLAFAARYEPLEGAQAQRNLRSLSKGGEPDPITGVADALLRSHPPSARREAAIEAESKALKSKEPGRQVYRGAANYQRRVPVAIQPME